MSKIGTTVLAAWVCLLLAATQPTGATSPESVFRDRGLTPSGFWLILPNEAGVHDGVWAIQQADEGIRGESAGRRNVRFELANGRRTLDGLEDQFIAANTQLTQSIEKGKSINQKNTDLYNQWIESNNELQGKRDVLAIKIDKEQRSLEDLKNREGEVEDSRARYISLVMDIGTKAESVAAAYTALTHDSELTTAIAQVNQASQPPLRLGPTPAFLDDLKFVRKCAKDVISGTVPVEKTRSIGGLHVQAVLNGKVTDTMVWDSGADVVVLSAATGRALGLTMTDRDPTIEAIVADGRTVKAKQILLDSIRLGGFTLRDVECDVMPDIPGAPATDDLLGDTFQSHFLSRLDQRTGQLQLMPIDSSVTLGPVAEPLPKLTAGANYTNPDLARRATATASSTEDGYDPRGAIDGVIGGSPKSQQNEWACGQQTGSITLTWPDQLIISSVKLWDRVNNVDHILSGQLVFDDGSTVPFSELPQDGTPLAVRFRPKYVRWMRVEILTVSPNSNNPGFAEIAAFR
jgi:clan AA aspartic protease (TIGR02281 family)